MAKSPEELAHQEWIGYVQPVGLVVSVPAMLEAQCYVNRNIAAEHARFLNCLPRDGRGEIIPEIRSLREFTQKVLGWQPDDLAEVPQRAPLSGEMASLEVVLPQYHETLRPTRAVPAFRPKEGESPWMMLVQELVAGTAFDDPSEADSHRHWNAAPQAKFERLLRETSIPLGLLFNQRQFRLVYAPRGESSGHATFNVAEMMQVAGRPMFAALHMLLNADRMFSLGDNQRLPAILETSRKYQNTVSTKLAEQVLAALYELMRGFQAANDFSEGKLLRELLESDPNHVYSGLLTVLMRLVFLMYAEDRDLMSSDPVYSNHYSVNGLFDRLRSDAGRHPDTMNQRFGSWSQLLTLFRLVFEGGQHGEFHLPARKGYLFDPDRYPFLEGRSRNSRDRDVTHVPRIPDGVVYRVLRNLLILDGERLSYRRLDVEQIGSVYETVMGFNLEVAQGKSIAIKPAKSHGAPATINLEALLATKGKDRAKWLKEQADQTLPKQAAAQLKDAGTIDELLEALEKKIAKKVTPRVLQKGAIVLQPSDERRRSGSHYTPRSLTEPIVRTTLEPTLKAMVDPDVELPKTYEPTREDKRRYTQGELGMRVRLSEKALEAARAARAVGTPHPYQILDLKICDPAMGSGAFLVEACRQLGDELVAAWHAHDRLPTDIPPDEDEVLYARRLIAQRCLYGVDKNPMAVDLAKLSLWLVTLAKSHPFTFLDHSLRHGDSLVGLTRRQIAGFHWEPKKQKDLEWAVIESRIERATEERRKILDAREATPYRDQEQRLAAADEALSVVRLIGDACVSAFFAGKTKKDRETRVDTLFSRLSDWFASGMPPDRRGPIAEAAAGLRQGEHPISPLHWEIEFPEVFARQNGGFDVFIGNPPFLGGSRISSTLGAAYLAWLLVKHSESHGNADIVAHFYRHAFSLLRHFGTLGLIATNTIGQGDTRSTGLRSICASGGTIYSATRRLQWPGLAAVIVSVVHVYKGRWASSRMIDGREVSSVSAFLFHRGGNDDPHVLGSFAGMSFLGSKIYGQGFTFDDSGQGTRSNPLSEMHRLIEKDARNKDRIFPYIGGEEVNDSPTHTPRRFVINFGQSSLAEAEQWPDLMQVVREKVKPERDRLRQDTGPGAHGKKWWWQFQHPRQPLYAAIAGMERVLVISGVGQHCAFTFSPSGRVFSHSLVVFAFSEYQAFGVLQSRVHETWARFFSSSMKDDLRYTSTTCFDTYPFPLRFLDNEQLGHEAAAYFNERAAQMVEADEGLTKIYNRFHDPHEQSLKIQRLRELHEAMDRAVLEAYGWHDLAEQARCEFLLNYEEDGQDEAGGPTPSKRKKPWRLRWPDDLRDEVLARLLELNEQRHKEELLAGSQTSKPQEEATTKPRKVAKAKTGASASQHGLWDDSELTDADRRTLIVVSAWGEQTWVDRKLFGQALLLWKNKKHRQHLLGQGQEPKKGPASVGSIPQIIGRAVNQGWVEPRESEGIQWLRLKSSPSPVGKLTTAEQQTIEGIRDVVRLIRESDEGVIEQTEDSIRATKEFV